MKGRNPLHFFGKIKQGYLEIVGIENYFAEKSCPQIMPHIVEYWNMD